MIYEFCISEFGILILSLCNLGWPGTALMYCKLAPLNGSTILLQAEVVIPH